MVDILLKEGANPNGSRRDDRTMEWGLPPLVICLNPKHHKYELEVDGLFYRKSISQEKDVDYLKCVELLLQNEADPNIEIVGKRRRPRPLFHAPRLTEAVLTKLLEYMPHVEQATNQSNIFGESPLVLVAREPGD